MSEICEGVYRTARVLIALEYIGKEANRWEEQLHLGEIPEAQIEYCVSADGRRRIIAALAEAARRFTQVALAEEAGISRQELAAIIEEYTVPRMRTLRALVAALAILIQSRDTGMGPG
jgi:DNA-binding phage protein